MSIVYTTTVVIGTFPAILTIVVVSIMYFFLRDSDSYKKTQYIQLYDCQSCQRLSLCLALTK